MKDEILALLTTKFTGVSVQVLSRIAEKLAKTATDATTAVAGVEIQNVIESHADYRATEATTNSVANYETKHGLKDGQKVNGDDPDPNEPDPTGKDSETSAAIKTLLGVVKTLTDEVTAIKTGKITDSRKQRFDAIIANLPENQKKAYQRTSIDSLKDEAFEALIVDVTAEVGVIEAEVKAKGSVFARPLGGDHNPDKKEPTAKELDDAVSQLNLS